MGGADFDPPPTTLLSMCRVGRDVFPTFRLHPIVSNVETHRTV